MRFSIAFPLRNSLYRQFSSPVHTKSSILALVVAELNVCPKCGQSVDPWPTDDDKTPVDGRLEKFAQANIVLMEAALEETRKQLAIELLTIHSLEIEKSALVGEVDRLKMENTKLRPALAGRNRKL